MPDSSDLVVDDLSFFDRRRSRVGILKSVQAGLLDVAVVLRNTFDIVITDPFRVYLCWFLVVGQS